MSIELDLETKKEVHIRDVFVDSCATCAHCSGMEDCYAYCDRLIDRENYVFGGEVQLAMVYPNQICDYFERGEE